jgi:hypothetical protein
MCRCVLRRYCCRSLVYVSTERNLQTFGNYAFEREAVLWMELRASKSRGRGRTLSATDPNPPRLHEARAGAAELSDAI